MEKIKFEDGQLVRPAYVTIDNVEHEVTPAVFEGNTPLSSYNLNKMQSEIIEDGIIVSPTEPTADRRKVWFQKGKNYINENLLKMETVNGVTCSIADGKIVFNGTATNNSCFRIPIFLKKGNYVFSWYGKHVASHFTFRNQNNEYITTLELPEGGDNKILTVTTDDEYSICLNINKDKAYTASNTSFNVQLEQGTEATDYEAYVNNTVYVKNDNDEYEEFVKKEEERISTIENNLNTVKNKIDTKVSGVKLLWGKELKFNLYSPQQALVLVGHTTMALCWYSGGGFDYTVIAGTDISLTASENVITLKRTNNTNFSASVFIF